VDPIERAIALMIFLRWWDEDPEDMTDEQISKLVKHFETGFLPSLNEPHGGDCTKAPGPCTRCHTEDLLATAKRIAAAIGPK
jgi:hypothetical protein